MAILYQTTNKVNNKMYIGVHIGNNLKYLGSGIHLKRAIELHGRENFVRETLFEFDTMDEAYAKEAELVTPDIVDDPNYYNMIPGGRGGKHRIVSDETKRKMSESAKIRMERDGSPTAGGHTEETKAKISTQRRLDGTAKGDKNPMFGKKQPSLSERNRAPKKWMNDGKINKLATLDKVQALEDAGWVFGRLNK